MNASEPGPKAVPGLIIRSERCEKCKWVQPLQGTEMQCRRNPPTFIAIGVPAQRGIEIQQFSNWPPTQANFWCGEFKPRIEGLN